jgi:uncharacterized protein YjbI with pentapeptide repeats
MSIFLKYNLDKKFEKINLSKEIFKEIEFEDCEFLECSFLETKFERCRFINCKFTNCMISAIDISNCYFSEIFFLNSKVIGIDWTKAQLIQVLNFNKCKVNYSNFRFLKMNKIKMIDCEAKEVDFSGSNLSDGNFENTDFDKSIFVETNLTKVNFRNAKNYYLDAKKNIIKGAHFSLPEALTLLSSLEIYLD